MRKITLSGIYAVPASDITITNEDGTESKHTHYFSSNEKLPWREIINKFLDSPMTEEEYDYFCK